jgi:hypothetical protein
MHLYTTIYRDKSPAYATIWLRGLTNCAWHTANCVILYLGPFETLKMCCSLFLLSGGFNNVGGEVIIYVRMERHATTSTTCVPTCPFQRVCN